MGSPNTYSSIDLMVRNVVPYEEGNELRTGFNREN